MNEIIKFLTENRNGFLATIDGDKPRVRPIAFKLEDEGRLYFCISKNKAVYRQLMECPAVEYAVTSKDLVTLRMSGMVKFAEDIETKEKILLLSEQTKSIYKTADNPVFAVFYIEHGTASIVDIKGKVLHEVDF